jgi:hypothetical protein
MSQQYNKVIKRKRRVRYIKRRQDKLAKAYPRAKSAAKSAEAATGA